jgi:hypothetical protein
VKSTELLLESIAGSGDIRGKRTSSKLEPSGWRIVDGHLAPLASSGTAQRGQ